jgi:hypothetical protein
VRTARYDPERARVAGETLNEMQQRPYREGVLPISALGVLCSQRFRVKAPKMQHTLEGYT